MTEPFPTPTAAVTYATPDGAAGSGGAPVEDNFGMHVARTTRTCQACGQDDDHPRHTIYSDARHPITGDLIDLSVERHMDCCRDAGCHDGTCDVILGHAGDKRGVDLGNHLHDEAAALAPLVQAKIDENVAAAQAAAPAPAGE